MSLLWILAAWSTASFLSAGGFCVWAASILNEAKREREEAEVEHRAAEMYWGMCQKKRRKR